jgi:formyltetrahydrofolate deformylase
MIADVQPATAILLVSCRDQPGLVHAVAQFVLDLGGNILHAEQHTDREAGVFFQR